MSLATTPLSSENQVVNSPEERECVSTHSRWPRVSRNVVLLGITSLLTDLSSEMVSAVLPLYLTLELKLTPLQFGAFDGLYQAMTAPVRILGGVLADRYQRYKEIAALGYGLSALSKIGLWAAGNLWGLVTIFLFLDRLGKGGRTAPRDALLVLSSTQQSRAETFGIHRALDTLGALLGPLLAFILLGLIPSGFDVVFIVSFCFALIGVGVVTLLVENRRPLGRLAPQRMREEMLSSVELLRFPPVRILFCISILLSAMTVSDAFVYLTLQERAHLSSHLFPLLALGTALTNLILSVPMGKLADGVGRRRVFWGGYALLGGTYGVLLLPTFGPVALIIGLVLLGGYYAATDGVLMAMAGDILPQSLLTSGLALLTTVTVLMRFLSSIVFGSLWAWGGPEEAVKVFGLGLLASLAFSHWLFTRQPEFARI